MFLLTLLKILESIVLPLKHYTIDSIISMYLILIDIKDSTMLNEDSVLITIEK